MRRQLENMERAENGETPREWGDRETVRMGKQPENREITREQGEWGERWRTGRENGETAGGKSLRMGESAWEWGERQRTERQHENQRVPVNVRELGECPVTCYFMDCLA